MIRVVRPGSGSLIFLPIPDPGIKRHRIRIRNTGFRIILYLDQFARLVEKLLIVLVETVFFSLRIVSLNLRKKKKIRVPVLQKVCCTE